MFFRSNAPNDPIAVNDLYALNTPSQPSRTAMRNNRDATPTIHNIKKIEGYDNYYRLRVGDYRLGLKLSGNTIELIRFLHRRDIYRRFP
jgi:mRNA-degrading endonuclease RelE of RelBE toxin-antitoxin system